MLIPHAIAITTPPGATAVTLSEIKSHLLVEHNQDDDILLSLLMAATSHAERELGAYLLPQTVEVSFAERDLSTLTDRARHIEHTRLEIPVHPLRSVSSVTYLDALGTTQTWPSSKWQLWSAHRPPILAPVCGETWPALRPGALRAMWLTCAVGSATVAAVPEAAKQAVKLIVAQNYANKGDGRDPTGELGIPPAAHRFLSYLREDFYR